MERQFVWAEITPKGEAALRGGHPWVFQDEITALSAPPDPREASMSRRT